MSPPRSTLSSVALFAALAFALQLGLPSSGSASSAELRHGSTSVTLEPHGSAYIAKVELDGKAKGEFLIDTGATYTLISPKMAKKLRIRKGEGYAATFTVADGRTVEGRVVLLDEIRVGRAKVYDTEVAILDTFGDTGLDGLLGMSFLRHFKFKIDHQESKMVLYETD